MSTKNPTKQEKFYASTGKKKSPPKKSKASAMNEMKTIMMEKMMPKGKNK